MIVMYCWTSPAGYHMKPSVPLLFRGGESESESESTDAFILIDGVESEGHHDSESQKVCIVYYV